jgi:co-chaperonin GroES (HSP10)
VKSSGIGFKDLPKLSEINPGIRPQGFRVLVLAREINDKMQVKGPMGQMLEFEIPKVAGGDIEREEAAGSEGLLVAMGDQAGHERWRKTADGAPDFANGHPMIGDVVLFARYSGKHAEFTGADGRTYRMMNDEDVLGVREHLREPLNVAKTSRSVQVKVTKRETAKA